MTRTMTRKHAGCLGAAIALVLIAAPATAQEIDHSKMHHPPAKQTTAKKKSPTESATKPKPAPRPTVKKTARPAPAAKPASTDPHAGHGAAASPEAGVDHSKMDHSKMDEPKTDHSAMDHSKMDHSTMDEPKTDHSTMDHSKMDHSKVDEPKMDHSKMDHSGMAAAPQEPLTPIPVLTEADRIGAIPPDHPHPVHDNEIFHYVLFNRLEASDADEGAAVEWEGQAWVGTDLDRLWLRSEGEQVDGSLESANLEVLYGRSVTPWWDVVAGIRHDFAPGRSQDFLALGVMGLAPYMFEVEATAYLGQSGRSELQVEAEYEMLLTNRLILQPLVEVNVFGKSDPGRGIGSGLGTVEAGLRLRYEIDRRFAPYVGVVHERAFGRTADLRRDAGGHVDDTRAVAGFRIWF